jgi:hypothetical protein
VTRSVGGPMGACGKVFNGYPGWHPGSHLRPRAMTPHCLALLTLVVIAKSVRIHAAMSGTRVNRCTPIATRVGPRAAASRLPRDTWSGSTPGCDRVRSDSRRCTSIRAAISFSSRDAVPHRADLSAGTSVIEVNQSSLPSIRFVVAKRDQRGHQGVGDR